MRGGPPVCRDWLALSTGRCRSAVAGPGLGDRSVATGEGRAFVEFTFDVRSGPSGENPSGTVRFDALLIDLGELPVSCLTVSGNRASMIALILSSSPSARRVC